MIQIEELENALTSFIIMFIENNKGIDERKTNNYSERLLKYFSRKEKLY